MNNGTIRVNRSEFQIYVSQAKAIPFHFQSTDNGGAKAGITTCSLSTDFIISVPDGADNEWKVSMYPTLKTYFFSDLFGFHDQYETLFDDAAESWIGIEKVFNLPTVDLKDE